MGLVILAIFLTFVSSIGSHLFKRWSLQKGDWFLSPYFKMQMEHQWYLFFGGWKMFDLIVCYVAAKISALVSDTLFLFFVVILGYVLIDNLMFWWNFNDEFYIYLDLLWTTIALARRCIFRYRPETTTKIKSLF